jgi:DnaJ-class molecular chaperone
MTDERSGAVDSDRPSYFDHETICDNCRGTGRTWGAYAGKWLDCGRCHGTGEDPRITTPSAVALEAASALKGTGS